MTSITITATTMITIMARTRMAAHKDTRMVQAATATLQRISAAPSP